MSPKVRAMELAFTFCDPSDVIKPNIRSIRNAIKHVKERLNPNATPSNIIIDGEYWAETITALENMNR